MQPSEAASSKMPVFQCRFFVIEKYFLPSASNLGQKRQLPHSILHEIKTDLGEVLKTFPNLAFQMDDRSTCLHF